MEIEVFHYSYHPLHNVFAFQKSPKNDDFVGCDNLKMRFPLIFNRNSIFKNSMQTIIQERRSGFNQRLHQILFLIEKLKKGANLATKFSWKYIDMFILNGFLFKTFLDSFSCTKFDVYASWYSFPKLKFYRGISTSILEKIIKMSSIDCVYFDFHHQNIYQIGYFLPS